MAGWHHWPNGRESEGTPGVGDGQGGLACCNSWGRKESDTTERLNWTELNWPHFVIWFLPWVEVWWEHLHVSKEICILFGRGSLLFCYSVQFSCSVTSNSWQPHGLQRTRSPCPSPIRRVCSNSCPLSRWCHPTISSSVVPFFSCLESFPASGSFPMSWVFISSSQSVGASASASVLPMNI